jgi:DNA-binding XRE family transcriptional regulator
MMKNELDFTKQLVVSWFRDGKLNKAAVARATNLSKPTLCLVEKENWNPTASTLEVLVNQIPYDFKAAFVTDWLNTHCVDELPDTFLLLAQGVPCGQLPREAV